MKFSYQINETSNHKNILYLNKEFSLDIEPYDNEIDFELSINQLCLTVVNQVITQITGYLPNSSWNSTVKIPSSQVNSANLIIVDKYECGFCYRVFNDEQPVSFNYSLGWICIGNVNAKGEWIEFIKNCIAVIEDNNLKAIWIKPKFID